MRSIFATKIHAILILKLLNSRNSHALDINYNQYVTKLDFSDFQFQNLELLLETLLKFSLLSYVSMYSSLNNALHMNGLHENKVIFIFIDQHHHHHV